MTTSPDGVHLFEIEPDLTRFLAEEDRAEAARVPVPAVMVERGPLELGSLLGRAAAFGAMVLDGMLLERIQLANHLTMKVYGPGDLVARIGEPASMLVHTATFSATDGTRLALLGNEVLLALRRWPALAAGLHARTAEQAERVAIQLAICQLPRVEERLMALLWWLAEVWGHVTSVGTIVPLTMTHDVLGALVGARRPTVTLALGELVDRGAIARQDHGWLLLEPPPTSTRSAPAVDDPSIIAPGRPVWQSCEEEPDMTATHLELLETVSRLREQHEHSQAMLRERLLEVRRTREALAERRRGTITPPRAPSS